MRFLLLTVLAGFLVLGVSSASLREGERERREESYEEEMNDNLQSLLRTLFRAANKQVYAQIVNDYELTTELTIKRNLVVGTYRKYSCDTGDDNDKLKTDLRTYVQDYITFLMDILLTPSQDSVVLESLVSEDDIEQWDIGCLPDEELKEQLIGQLKLLLNKLLITIQKEIRHAVMLQTSATDDFKLMRDELLKLFQKSIVGGSGKDDANREFAAKSLEYFRALVKYFLSKDDVLNEINYGFFDDMVEKVKKMIYDTIDVEKLKAKLKEYFDKIGKSELSKTILDILQKKGKDEILKYLKSLLQSDVAESQPSLRDLYEKLKEFFKKAKLELKEKFAKFGEWVQNNFKDELEGQDKTLGEKLKCIAKKLLSNYMEIKKDVFSQALEYLKPYRENLGDLYDDLKAIWKKHFEKNY